MANFFIWSLLIASALSTAQNDSSYSEELLLESGSSIENEDTSFDQHEEKLIIDLFQGYNHLIRPVPSSLSPPILVEFGVAMILLINVDERDQCLQTNVWLTMKWNDFQLKWNPEEYGNISNLHVPSERVWLPDIVLFNNADGTYEVSFKSNVFIEHTGDVTWVPPARFISSCLVDAENFPFDEQECRMIFGSWTYNKQEVILTFYNNISAVQLNDYSKSGIWDVMDVPGKIDNENGTASKAIFTIVIRRKSLFYTVILIIPTVLMAFLSMMAFYLPADSAEKISLSINILLALVVFLVLVSKILPPSNKIPLMCKYLLMAFVLNVVTVAITVVIVNIYFRSPLSHEMSPWVRTVFLEFLPRVLMMKRPERIPIFNGYFVEEYSACEIFDASLVMPSVTATIVPFINMASGTSTPDNEPTKHHRNCSKHSKKSVIKMNSNGDDIKMHEINKESLSEKMSRDMKRTVESIAYIAEHMKADMADKKIRDDWKYVAMVIDRLLMLLFFGITLGGTIHIIFLAPNLWEFVDQDKIIEKLTAKYGYAK